MKCHNNNVIVVMGSINQSKSFFAHRSLPWQFTTGGYHRSLLWEVTAGVYHRSLPWKFTVGSHCRSLPQEFTVGGYCGRFNDLIGCGRDT